MSGQRATDHTRRGDGVSTRSRAVRAAAVITSVFALAVCGAVAQASSDPGGGTSGAAKGIDAPKAVGADERADDERRPAAGQPRRRSRARRLRPDVLRRRSRRLRSPLPPVADRLGVRDLRRHVRWPPGRGDRSLLRADAAGGSAEQRTGPAGRPRRRPRPRCAGTVLLRRRHGGVRRALRQRRIRFRLPGLRRHMRRAAAGEHRQLLHRVAEPGAGHWRGPDHDAGSPDQRRRRIDDARPGHRADAADRVERADRAG